MRLLEQYSRICFNVSPTCCLFSSMYGFILCWSVTNIQNPV
uniref:Uncharacterized protein n=1 Tax=Arundo donax TaxID=35708 RepID=A0A0A8Z9S7_ARUDO